MLNPFCKVVGLTLPSHLSCQQYISDLLETSLRARVSALFPHSLDAAPQACLLHYQSFALLTQVTQPAPTSAFHYNSSPGMPLPRSMRSTMRSESAFQVLAVTTLTHYEGLYKGGMT